jgi:hypothetical protein
VAAWDKGVDQGDPDLAGHAQVADRLADRVAAMVRGDVPSLRSPIAAPVVDDDLGGPYAVGPRDVFHETLRGHGVAVHTGSGTGGTGSGGTRVVLVYAEPRSWKGRAALGPRSLSQLRHLLPGAGLVILFAHPRLAAQVPGDVPILCCWHGQPLMQRAAARWVLPILF